MLLPDVPEIFLGDTGVTRIYLGTDEAWPCVGGLCPERMLTYRFVDSGGTPFSEQGPLYYYFDFDTATGDHYFKTTEGYEEPFYNNEGVMIWDNPLTDIHYSFPSHAHYPSGQTVFLEVNVPEGVVNLNQAFEECQNLKNVSIPSTAREFWGAFYRCYYLESVTIPEGVTELLGSTFFACHHLKYLYLPSTLERVDNWIIRETNELEEIHFGGTMAQFMETDGVENFNPYNTEALKRVICTDGIITVPFGYTQYDYIAPTGTTYGNDYITINKQCTTGFSAEAKFRMLANTSSIFLGFLHTSDSSDYRIFYSFIGGGTLYFDFGSNRIQRRLSGDDSPINKDLNWRIYNYGVWDNDTDEAIVTGTTQTTAPGLVQYVINVGSGRIYGVKMYDIVDGQRTRQLDLIPVTRNSDGVAGLYDRIGGGFYTVSNPSTIGAYNNV